MSTQCSDGHLVQGEDGIFINAFKELSDHSWPPYECLIRLGHTRVAPTLGKPKQKDHRFEASLGCIGTVHQKQKTKKIKQANKKPNQQQKYF